MGILRRDRIRIRVYQAPPPPGPPPPDLLAESAAREEAGRHASLKGWAPGIPPSAWRAPGNPDPVVFGPPRPAAQPASDQEK